MKTPTKRTGILAAGLALALAGTTAAMNVVETLAARPEFSTLVTAVTEAGLGDALASAEDITIFAPDNAAFAQIPEADLTALLADKAALTRVLTYHVGTEELRFRELSSGPLATLLDGESVDIHVRSYFGGWFRRVKVDDATITRANIGASNGVIHRINQVLDPDFDKEPTILEIAAADPNFSILASLVQQSGFDRALGSERLALTVFAPTNAAFEALGAETLAAVQADPGLVRKILRNHIARGTLDSGTLAAAGSVRTLLRVDLEVGPNPSSATGFGVDGKPLDAVDIPASNGIVHVVGEVLLPPTPQSLVDVASAREDLGTFVTAVGAAGLAPTFDSTRRWPAYTIFAPNNAAFEALPEGVLASLLEDPTGALAEVLQLHVVPGRLESSRLSDGQILTTLSGNKLTVGISDGTVTINNAEVVAPDQLAANGVIHVIDAVIVNDAYTIADFVAERPYLSTLKAALDAADLTGALDDTETELTLFAPINYAFGRLPEGTVEALLEDPAGDLTQILLYHVAAGSLSAEELVADGSATTLQGGSIDIESRTFRLWGWRFPYSIVTVNGNRVVAADIATDNGTVHLITGVLLPPENAE